MAVYLNGEEVGVIVNSGSAPEPPATKGKYRCLAIDYDGTILKEQWLNTGDTFTLPIPPIHDGLVFQEWSSTSDLTGDYITIGHNDIIIGPVYKTQSGLSEFDIEVTIATGLTINFNMAGNKNWGDGTTNNLSSHTYSEYGKYTITCDGTTIPVKIFLNDFGNDAANNINYTLKGVKIGENVSNIIKGAFENCPSITYIIIPNTLGSIQDNIFSTARSSLTTLIIPPTVTTIGTYAFSNMVCLKNLVLPSNVITIKDGAFSGCTSLLKIILPKSLSSIGSSAFGGSFARTEYDFTQCLNIPSLTNSNAFSSLNKTAKIYVKDELYDTWITSTNWTKYANQIYKASEMEVE